MGKMIDNPAAERARELANTGCFADMLELRLRLRKEGYAATDLRSDKLRRELMETIERKRMRKVRASHAPSPISQSAGTDGSLT